MILPTEAAPYTVVTLDTPLYGERLAQWIEELRSGNYKQVKGHLKEVSPEVYGKRHVIGHCCLGVACELIPGVTGATPEDDEEEEFSEAYIYFNGSSELPPAEFYRWLGLGDYEDDSVYVDIPVNLVTQDGSRTPLASAGDLAALNDSGEFTFDMIADCIAYFGVTAADISERRLAQP